MEPNPTAIQLVSRILHSDPVDVVTDSNEVYLCAMELTSGRKIGSANWAYAQSKVMDLYEDFHLGKEMFERVIEHLEDIKEIRVNPELKRKELRVVRD